MLYNLSIFLKCRVNANINIEKRPFSGNSVGKIPRSKNKRFDGHGSLYNREKRYFNADF